MSGRRRVWSARWLRPAVQGVFLLLFVVLLLCARPGAGSGPNPAVKLFFFFDPLILLATALAAHSVPPAMLLALVVIAATLVAGRVFCGWICPLGTVHDIVGWLFDRGGRGAKLRNQWSPWQRTKYYLLIAFGVMALFGGHWVCTMDPLVFLYRTVTTAGLPAGQWAVEESSTAVYHADPGVGPARLTLVTEPVYTFLRDNVFVVPRQAFLGGGLIAVLFVGVLLLNGFRRRFWCRYLCPLGALLGLCARRPLLRRDVKQQDCNQCGLCVLGCHGAAAEGPGGQWKPSECFVCLNCTDSCTRRAMSFRWTWPWRREPAVAPLGMSRRSALGAALGGAATLALMRSNPQARGAAFHPRLIRPPGARDEREFLARCTACGLCMKVCPTGGLQPAVAEAGCEGLWTPRLVPRIGYCEYECNLCGQVCPTGAIEPLSIEAKQQVKIGLACFDTTRCIPYAYGRDCMVCEEHCPIPDKAIYFVEVPVPDRDGKEKIVKQPHVDPDLCIGCGICESVCPYKDRPAIRVSSANETRNPANQPILPAAEESGEDYY